MALIVADRIAETSSTAGTGAFTLSGALTGFKRFSSACLVGDTCYYLIEAVNSAGAPTGQWESGLGTYSADNTLSRTEVRASSTGSKVSFSGGTKRVMIAAVTGSFVPVPNVIPVTGTDYALASTDNGSHILFQSADPSALLIPANATVALPVGTTLTYEQYGAGAVSIIVESGVTLNGRDSAFETAGQYAVAQVRQVEADVWTAIGDLVAGSVSPYGATTESGTGGTTGTGDLTVTLDTYSVSKLGKTSTIVTDSVTATGSGGTGGPYTYSWTYVSGNFGTEAVNPSAAATGFRATGMSTGDELTAAWKCTVSDGTGTADSGLLTVTIRYVSLR